MPNVDDLTQSRFLTKYDVQPPILVTIKSWEKVNVAMETQAPEMRYVLNFKEVEKPLVLNKTNGLTIKVIAKSGDFDHFIGKQIVLFNDETVMFAGKLTGGIRVRAKKGGQPNPDYVDPEQRPIQDEPELCPDCGQPCANGCECVPF